MNFFHNVTLALRSLLRTSKSKNGEGFIYIDKPKSITSYDVIRKLKRLLPKGTKIGHSGTLDPLATGLLLIGIGRGATKKLGTLLLHDKVYVVTALFGKKYDSQDVTGTLLEERDTTSLHKEQIEKILSEFIGRIEQIPPMYSAIKVKGQPLYKKARIGEVVERSSRKITIMNIELISWTNPRAIFRVECSSGTYIRTLIDDIGTKLGVGASVEELRRTNIGTYSVKRAISLERIKKESDISKYLTVI